MNFESIADDLHPDFRPPAMNPPRGSRRKLSMESLDPRLMLNADFRAIDGFGNNTENPDWGGANTQLLRRTTAEYFDGVSQPSAGADGSGRPNPRELSNAIVAQANEVFNYRGLTNFVFQWGQFIDHDLSLTEESHPIEGFHIEVPEDDPEMFPGGFVPLLRSRFDPETGTGEGNPRQQINQITSFIDASMVYGSDQERALAIRTLDGGRLKTSEGGLLPFNEGKLYNAAPPPFEADEYYLAGDIRANEQPGLTSLHTLFVREHNRLADEIASAEFSEDDLSDAEVDESIYQRARLLVGAMVQSITYNEFLPALLGPSGVAPYGGYDAEVNPGIANIFSAAMYRVGHTMLPNDLMMLADDGGATSSGRDSIPLADSFFQPQVLQDFGIEPFLKGLSVQLAQEIDALVVDSVRNMLFDPPAQFDLAAINIQRGRDHGLPDYNQTRVDVGLEPKFRFSEITDRRTARKLSRAYDGDINNIDVWLGAIAERHVDGGSVGELMQTVLVDQFSRIRDGDRYYFENTLQGEQLRSVQQTRLADIVARNTALTSLQSELFRSEAVFVHRASVDEAVNWRVELDAGNILIVDLSSDEVVASQRRKGIEHIVLYGSSEADQISIDSSLAARSIAVEIHSGDGQDRLQLLGNNRGDHISIQESHLRFNSMRVAFGGVSTIEVDARGGRDFVLGAASGVPLIVSGGTGRDYVIGSQHADLLIGGRGHDILVGLGGNDLLMGDAGRDLLFGGRGDDILIGGRGRDWLIGGRGVDVEIQGGFPNEDELEGTLWDEALDRWHDDLLRQGYLSY